MQYVRLSELLRPYKQSAIATATGATPATVNNWYHGRRLPPPEMYPALAGILRITVEQLADIVANDQKTRALVRAAAVKVAV